jgi:hypothetical protein
MLELEEALAAVPPGNTSVRTLRRADETIDDLPRRLVAALVDGSLVLARSLDGPPDARITFGLLAVVKWLASLGPERLEGVPPSFFSELLEDDDGKLRRAAVVGMAHYPDEALTEISARADSDDTEQRELAAGMAAGLCRDREVRYEDAVRLRPVLVELTGRVRGQAKKDAKDALEVVERRVTEGFKTALAAALSADDADAVAAHLEDRDIDGRMPGEMSGDFTFLALACSHGARRTAQSLLDRGADASRAVLALAGMPTADGLSLLLDLTVLDAPSLDAALAACALAPSTGREAVARTLAAHLESIDVHRSPEPGVPFLVTLARRGLLFVLDGTPQAAEIAKALPPSLVARLRQSNLALPDGATAAHIVPAAIEAVRGVIQSDARHGSPRRADQERLETLERCRDWLVDAELL